MARNTVGNSKSRESGEDMDYLRQQIGSLALRGRYAECAKLIEDNIAKLYDAERWPENFFAALKTYQRCYPALNRAESLEESLAALLRKRGIPFVFARFFKDPPPRWSGEYFRDQALKTRTDGDFEAALAWCRLAVKADPLSSNLHLLMGWIYEDLEQSREAVSAFERALEINPNNYKASQGIAREYTKTNLNKALAFINQAIGEHPDEAGFWGEKAAVMLKMNKPEEAMGCYDKAAEIDPYNPEYVYQKGELLLAEDKEMAAVTQFKRAVALNAKHLPSLGRLAYLFRRSQPSTALEYITAVVSMEPENVGAGILRAQILRRVGDVTSSTKQYLAVLALEENNITAISGAASCYLREDAGKALEYYGKAVALEENNPEFRMGKAKAHEMLRQEKEAAEEYRAVTSLDKKNHEAWFRLGLLQRESDRNAALGCFDKAVSLAPEEPEYHAEKGKLLLTMGPEREKEAVDCINTACKYDPGNAQLHLELASLLLRAGNRASAIKNYQEALSLNPSLVPACEGLARMLAVSDPEIALGYVNSAIGMDLANPEYYFLKSKILAEFKDNRRALEALQRQYEGPAGGGTDGSGAFDEIRELAGGGALRVALMHCDRAIELAPSNTSYLCYRARLHHRMGRQKKAMELYESLLKSDPDNHEALYGVGVILSSKKDKKALEYLDKAISISPAMARYHAAKAAFLAADPQKYREAVECYDAAITLDNGDHGPVLEKARLLDRNGDLYPAMANYRRALLVNPNCLEATARLGELLCDLRPDAAYNYIKHGVSLDPEDWALRIRLARVQMARGNPGEAEAEAAAAMELAKGSAEAYYAMARAYAEKYPEAARKYILTAVEKAPDNGDYQFLHGNICLALDDLAGAQACYERAAVLGVREGDANAREKAVELLYRQGRPEALEAAEALPETAEGFLLKARICDELADPPRTAEAVGILNAAIKKYPKDIPLRELLIGLLQKKKAFLRAPIEKAKLDSLRKKLKKAEAAVHVEEVTFESALEEAEAGLNPGTGLKPDTSAGEPAKK